MLEEFVRDALFLACFLICYDMFSCLFDMADPWKTMKNHGFSYGFLIFLGVGDVVRILKQHSICIKKTYQKRMENPRIWHVSCLKSFKTPKKPAENNRIGWIGGTGGQ